MSKIDQLVNRFLAWPVPADVHPDGTPGKPGRTGTNLLTASQAKQMLEHVLGDAGAEEKVKPAQNIFAHTEPTPEGGYPAFLSINRDSKGIHTIMVRSRGYGGLQLATIEVSEAVLAKLAVALLDPRKRLGYGGHVGRQANE